MERHYRDNALQAYLLGAPGPDIGNATTADEEDLRQDIALARISGNESIGAFTKRMNETYPMLFVEKHRTGREQ